MSLYDFEVMRSATDRTPLSEAAKDDLGHELKFLDAFVTFDTEITNNPVTFKIGSQVLNWGESTFIQNGLNVINPFDVSKLRVAGAQLKENKLSFYYDSDAFISKGMVTILCDIYGDRNPSEIKNSDFSMLNTLELDTLLTPGRRNGVYSMLEKIKEYANSYL